MKRTLFTTLTALTVLAAVFFVTRSSGDDGLAKSKAAIIFNTEVAPIFFKNCAVHDQITGAASKQAIASKLQTLVGA